MLSLLWISMLLYEERLSTAPYTGIRDIDRVPASKLFDRLRVSQTWNVVTAYPRTRNNIKALGGYELGQENKKTRHPDSHLPIGGCRMCGYWGTPLTTDETR